MEDVREKERGVEREEASGDGLSVDLVDLGDGFAATVECGYEMRCLHANYLHLVFCSMLSVLHFLIPILNLQSN